MEYQSTPTVILSQSDWQENDRLITLLTQDFGKVSALCQGVKKSPSKLGGHLQPFACIEVELVRGKQFPRIINIGRTDHFKNIIDSLPRQMVGWFWLECVDKLTREHSPDPKLWTLIKDGLKALDTVELGQLRLVRSAFIFKLLEVLGYGFKLKPDKMNHLLSLSWDELLTADVAHTAVRELGRQSIKMLEHKLDSPLKTLKTVRDLTPRT